MNPPLWSELARASHDVRLVVSDMDGTLLTEAGEVPVTFWPVLDHMRVRGIVFVPASGRQYATLERLFAHVPEGVSFIAENGNLVVHNGSVLAATCVDGATVERVVNAVREADDHDLGLVVCGRDSAYIERDDAAFVEEAEIYYARLAVVDDLTAISDDVLKLAVYDFADAESTAAGLFGPLSTTHQVVVSGKHWIDIMDPTANKGRALRQLQQVTGITPAQTAVFGDYLNDLELFDAADLSFATANAHPQVRARARHLAPANHERGVVTVLSHLLGI